MNARILSFALLFPVAISSIKECAATPPAPVRFRPGMQSEEQVAGEGDGTFETLGGMVSGSVRNGRGAISMASVISMEMVFRTS